MTSIVPTRHAGGRRRGLCGLHAHRRRHEALDMASDEGSAQLEEVSPDEICRLVHERYSRLAKTGKPQVGEWTVLAGVVLTDRHGARVVSLGTGTKCLTMAQIAADGGGESLHDAHAEVCARRALLTFLLAEIQLAASSDDASSQVLQARGDGGSRDAVAFELRPEVGLHFYSSEVPCGDAAIIALPPTPSQTSAPEPAAKRLKMTGARPAEASALAAEAATYGAACEFGLVRTKPGRGGRTSCMSCSDKLVRWQALGVQGALLSHLLPAPIRFASITLGRTDGLESLSRALRRGGAAAPCTAGGAQRLAADAAAARAMPPPQPTLWATSRRFEHAAPPAEEASSLRPCSNSVLWSAAGLCEAINGMSGKRLGANKRAPSPKHRSAVCKALLMQTFMEVVRSLPPARLPPCLRVLVGFTEGTLSSESTGSMDGSSAVVVALPADYAELKALAEPYQLAKAAMMREPPFSDWVRAPRSCEAFALCCGRQAAEQVCETASA